MLEMLVRRAPPVLVIVGCMFVFGLLSYVQLPREAAPDVKIPVVLISTPYIGVAPEDVEQLITIPLERELANLKDLKKMESTSAEGASIVSLEFEPDVVIEDALQRVRANVDRAKPKLPEDAEDPQIREISFSDFPILIVTLAGDVDEQVLKELGEKLQDDVERVEGVLDARLSGGLTRELRVQVDPRRLANYGLGIQDVVNAVRAENVNIPGGEVDAGGSTILVRVPGQFDVARDIEEVAIQRTGNRPVFVRDVARVIDDYEDRDSYARMNGRSAVSLAITKRTGANIVSIADEVKALVAEHAKTWPEGVEYRALADQSEHIRDMVSDLENNVITAFLLVVGVIFFFMGARNSLFVALSIPLSMLTSFMVIQALGMTLNMIVLFSLILALGMLVDNAIVVVENVYRHVEEGEDLFTASVEGTREVAIAVAASTATTVAAFLPLVFWGGIMGQFMGYLPKVVIIVLVSSLVVAVAILPVTTAIAMKRSKVTADQRGTSLPMRLYQRLLEFSIDHRYLSVSAGVLTLVFTVFAYAALNHGTEFFPNTEPARATIAVRAPDGTGLEATDRIVRQIEALLATDPNVDVYVTETGVAGGGNPIAGAQAASNQARITVDFLPGANNAEPGQRTRVERTELTIVRLRAAIQEIPGAEITIDKERNGPPVGAPIGVEVSGDDFHEVGALAAQLKREIAAIEGATELRDDYRVGRPELRLRMDRGAVRRIGANTNEVALAVRTAIAGTEASAVQTGDEEHDIVVELDPRYRDNLQDVLAMRIFGKEDGIPGSTSVPLSSVAKWELAGGSGSIRHVDQKLVVSIEGEVQEGYNENAVRAQVAELLGSRDFPEGQHARLGGADDEQREAGAFLLKAFAIAVSLIALVLIAEFNGLSNPAIILFTVVLSLIGVLWGLILTGTPFGVIMTGIGVISLAGVVVNNAIVLLDYVDQLKERGRDTREALIEAGLTRFRPVMLTAITTVLGLVPMAVGVSIDFRGMRVILGGDSAEWWGGMAIAVVFGLSFATLLTLVMVPTAYSVIEDIRSLPVRARRLLGLGTAVATGAGVLLFAWPAHAVTLDEAIRAAERTNLDLAASEQREVMAETQRGRAWAALSPKLVAQGNYQLNEEEIVLDFAMPGVPDTGDPIVVQAKDYFSASATLSQSLFNAGAFPALQSTYATVAATRADEQRVRQQVVAGTARAFYQLAVARRGIEIADASLKSAENHLTLAERRFQAGAAPERVVLQARLGVGQARREVAAAREREVAAEEAFFRATGLPRDSVVELPPEPAPVASVEDALAQSNDLRVDRYAAEQRVRAAKLASTATAAGWLPNVDGRFTYSWTESPGFSDDQTQWILGLQANWTLWDGGARMADHRDRVARVHLAQLQVEQIDQIVTQEVRTAWERVQQSQLAFESAATDVQLGEENLRLAEAAFQAGSASWLEVDDARTALERARLSELAERANRDLATIDLQLATGAY